MVLCRGYPLPEDTNSSEEGTGDITAMPGMDRQPIHSDGTHSVQDLHYMATDGRNPAAAMPNGRYPEVGETTLLQPELVSVPLVKGPSGFGFAIADCPLGQKVKMILDAQWCRGLLKGDVIKEINRQNVQTLTHAQVVDILKDLPMGSEVNVLLLRGGEWWRESDLGSIYLLFILTTSHCRPHLALVTVKGIVHPKTNILSLFSSVVLVLFIYLFLKIYFWHFAFYSDRTNLNWQAKWERDSGAIVSASDVTPTERWLNVWCIWHTYLKTLQVVVGLVELYRISGRHVCRVL